MLGFYNQYLTKICSPEELGYYGSLALVYEFPNGIKMYLLDTCRKYVPYTFVYELFNAEGKKLVLRDKEVFYHYAPFVCNDDFFNRILKLGIEEEIEFATEKTPADEYLLKNTNKLFE
ncbi:MAG: hypothetical protein IJ215_02275 [Clostridia bacterium]|nr:hypothetical protein [Clostridia bacterium]